MKDRVAGAGTPTWSTVFSRSSVGSDTYFVKGTQESHIGLRSFGLEHDVFVRILKICEAHRLAKRVRFDGGPGSGCTEEMYFAFLDGGIVSRASDFFWGRHGAWVFGKNAFRFLCFELGVAPPVVRDLSRHLRTRQELCQEVERQLRCERQHLERRLEELAEKW
jgi:hypothetical protein